MRIKNFEGRIARIETRAKRVDLIQLAAQMETAGAEAVARLQELLANPANLRPIEEIQEDDREWSNLILDTLLSLKERHKEGMYTLEADNIKIEEIRA